MAWLRISERSPLFQSKHRYLGGCDYCWPQNFCETFCNGDLLCPVDSIGNDAAANRTADILTPQFAPVCGVKHVEIPAHVAEENDASCGRRHAALNGIIRLCSPSPSARIGVDGVDQTGGSRVRVIEASKNWPVE